MKEKIENIGQQLKALKNDNTYDKVELHQLCELINIINTCNTIECITNITHNITNIDLVSILATHLNDKTMYLMELNKAKKLEQSRLRKNYIDFKNE